MPAPVQLSELVTRVRRRSEMENTNFVSDTEIEEYIEQSAGALMDLILEWGGAEHFIQTTPDHSTVAGTDTYTIYSDIANSTPAAVYRVVAVEAEFNGKWRRLSKYSVNQRLHMVDHTGWYEGGVFWRTQFNMTGSTAGEASSTQIRFIPAPQAIQSFRVIYVRYLQDWSSSQFTHLQGFSGWDEYIVVDAAMKCLEKEESDVTHLLARKAELSDRIRNATRQHQVVDGDAIVDIYTSIYDHPEYLPWNTA